MLACVDVGDAKAAACGPVLTGAKAAAQRTDKGKPRDDVGQGTTAKSESGKASKPAKKEQKKKFLGIFYPLSAMRLMDVGQPSHETERAVGWERVVQFGYTSVGSVRLN